MPLCPHRSSNYDLMYRKKVRSLLPARAMSSVNVRAAAFFTCAVSLFSQSVPVSTNPEGIEFFEKNIRPLLTSRCYGCHSSKLDQPMSGLLLDSRAGMLRGGKSGAPAIVPGKPDDSLLISAVRRVNKDLQMPPGKPL